MIADMLPPEKLTPIYDLIHRLEVKEEKSEKEKIKLRNLRRFISLFHNHAYCPLQKRELFDDELFSCMMCEYGHMTECHYPRRCTSGYCTHYKSERTQISPETQKIDFILNRIEGTILEQIDVIQGICDNLKFAKAMGFYSNEIDMIYRMFANENHYQQLLHDAQNLL